MAKRVKLIASTMEWLWHEVVLEGPDGAELSDIEIEATLHEVWSNGEEARLPKGFRVVELKFDTNREVREGPELCDVEEGDV